MESSTGDQLIPSEAECWECWNSFRVFSLPGTGRVGVTVEMACPYCGRPNEFRISVVRVEKTEVGEDVRRFLVLWKRLVFAGTDLQSRVRDGRRAITRCVARLQDSRARLEQAQGAGEQ